MQISPDGTLLAIAHRIDDGTEVTVLRRADHQLVTRVDPGSRGEVSSLQWMGSHQLLVAANRSVGLYSAPIVNPALCLLDINNKHPTILPANFIGTIDGDESHILVRTREVFEDGDCVFRVWRVATNHLKG